MLQGNLNKSELSQNNSDNFNHLQSDTSMGETGPSSNQQAFLAVQAKQGMPATEATDTDSSLASSNATHFAQLLSPQTENPGLNLISNSPSIISAAVISANVSITGTNSLSSAKTSLAAVDPILTEGVQSDPNTLALESNSEINPANTSPKLSIAPALGEGPWAAALGQQALFIAKNQMSTAQLTLNPEHLGPIQVTLDMKHDQASATFVSPHDAVRQAIEASLPQLRDMFTQAGLQLGQTQIQSNLDGQFAQQSQQNQNSFANRSGAVSTSTASTETIPTSNISAASSATRVSSGLLDTFA
jgi:flagellar hook-length control protein FliK